MECFPTPSFGKDSAQFTRELYHAGRKRQGAGGEALMKVVRDGLGFGDEERLHTFGFDGNHVVLIL